jgi:hypothetical protein
MELQHHHLGVTAIAVTLIAVPFLAYSQTPQAPIRGEHEAMRMVPARAELMRPLDTKKDQAGSEVQVKLRQKVTLTNGTILPNGTMLLGMVTTDDMQVEGMSKLALRFDRARLENGAVVPVKATIVGFFGPGVNGSGSYPVAPGDQVPNSWNDGTLQLDQIDAAGGVDLHSRIASANSGVFVSTKKDDIKLSWGSEIQFAIGPGPAVHT